MRRAVLGLALVLGLSSLSLADVSLDGSSYYYSPTQCLPAGANGPWTIATWFWVDSDTGAIEGIYAESRADTDNTSVAWIYAGMNVTGNKLRGQVGTTTHDSVNSITTGAWQSGVVTRATGAGVVTTVLNGDWANRGSGANGNSVTLAKSSLGCIAQGLAGYTSPLNGDVSIIAIYNTTWGESDVSAWHGGASPYSFQAPLGIFLLGSSPARNLCTGVTYTAVGSPTIFDRIPRGAFPGPQYSALLQRPRLCREEDYHAAA